MYRRWFLPIFGLILVAEGIYTATSQPTNESVTKSDNIWYGLLFAMIGLSFAIGMWLTARMGSMVRKKAKLYRLCRKVKRLTLACPSKYGERYATFLGANRCELQLNYPTLSSRIKSFPYDTVHGMYYFRHVEIRLLEEPYEMKNGRVARLRKRYLFTIDSRYRLMADDSVPTWTTMVEYEQSLGGWYPLANPNDLAAKELEKLSTSIDASSEEIEQIYHQVMNLHRKQRIANTFTW